MNRNQSRCPWQAGELPENEKRPTKKTVEKSPEPPPRKAKGTGIAPKWAGNGGAAEGPVPSRDDDGNSALHQFPKKQLVKDRRSSTYGRSEFDDTVTKGGRKLAVAAHPPEATNAFEGLRREETATRPGKSCPAARETSLWGGANDGVTPTRGRSVSPGHPARRAMEEPFAVTRSRSAEPGPRDGFTPTRSRRVLEHPGQSGSCPFDLHHNDGFSRTPSTGWGIGGDSGDEGGRRFGRRNSYDPGQVKTFRPSCRLFSTENTRDKIWGGGC